MVHRWLAALSVYDFMVHSALAPVFIAKKEKGTRKAEHS